MAATARNTYTHSSKVPEKANPRLREEYSLSTPGSRPAPRKEPLLWFLILSKRRCGCCACKHEMLVADNAVVAAGTIKAME